MVVVLKAEVAGAGEDARARRDGPMLRLAEHEPRRHHRDDAGAVHRLCAEVAGVADEEGGQRSGRPGQ